MEYLVRIYKDSFTRAVCDTFLASCFDDLFHDSRFTNWLSKFNHGHPGVFVSEFANGYITHQWSVNSSDDATDDIMDTGNYTEV